MPFRPPMGDRPPLVRELISAGGTLPTGVDMALVTAAGQNVIESMSGHIFHFLLSQRQNHKLSGHAVSRTHLEIPPLDLVYETAHGQEMLTINCIVTPEVLAQPAPITLSMLVMYGGNKIAAIPMDTIKVPAVTYRKTLSESDWTTGSYYNDNSQQVSQLKFSGAFAPIMASFSIVAGDRGPSIKVVDDHYACWNTKDFLLPGIKSGYINNYYGYSGQNGVPPIINGAANTVYFLGETFTLNPNTKVIEWTAADPDKGIPTFTSSTGEYCWGVDSVTNTDTITTTGGWTTLSASQSAELQANSPINPNTGEQGEYSWIWNTHEEYFFAMSSGVEISYATYTIDQSLNTYAGYYISIDASGSGSEELIVARATMSSVAGYDVVAVAHDAITRSPTFPTINETDLEQNISWQYATTYSGTSSYLYLSASGTTTTITGNDRTKGHVETSPDDPASGVWVHTGGYSSDTTTAQWRNLFFWPYGTHDKYFVNVTDETSYSSSDDWGDPITSGGSNTYSVTTPWGITFENRSFMRGWLHVSNGNHILQGILMMSVDGAILSKALYLDGVDYAAKLSEAVGVDLAEIDAVLFDISLAEIERLV